MGGLWEKTGRQVKRHTEVSFQIYLELIQWHCGSGSTHCTQPVRFSLPFRSAARNIRLTRTPTFDFKIQNYSCRCLIKSNFLQSALNVQCIKTTLFTLHHSIMYIALCLLELKIQSQLLDTKCYLWRKTQYDDT